MTLYNLRTSADAYTITKWDAFGNPEATYQLTQAECTCPAGHRHTCRHRQMLPDLLPIIDTEYFWDYQSNSDHMSRYTDFNGSPASISEIEESIAFSAPATQPSHPWRRI